MPYHPVRQLTVHGPPALCILAGVFRLAMIKFTWDLPFQIPLTPGTYECNVRGIATVYSHSVMDQERLDLRLGGISGSFGLQRDNLGILRFSQLAFTIHDSAMPAILEAFPELGQVTNPKDRQVVQSLALQFCNHFLNKIRLAMDSTDVRPIKEGDLAHLKYESADLFEQVRLYGGGMMLPIAGHSTETGMALAKELADPGNPMTFELDSLDAVRAGRDGLARESEILAIGALESALDHYLSRLWRTTLSSTERVSHAVATLGLNTSKKTPRHFTVEDVLRDAGVRRKFDEFASSNSVDDRTRIRIERAIDARNMVVHGGVALPPSFAERHAQSVRVFLHNYLRPTLDRIGNSPYKLEFLHAYEEATGTASPSALKQIAKEYLSTLGLSTLLYHERSAVEGISSDHLGSIVVVRVPFNNPRFTPHVVSLSLARIIVHFGERSRGLFSEAKVTDNLPFDDLYTGWAFVASEINKMVWDVAIDRVVSHSGFSEEIDNDIQGRADELIKFYQGAYVAPVSGEGRDIVEFMRLARILASLGSEARHPLLEAVRPVAPQIADLATSMVPLLKTVSFEQPDSVLEALIRAHDTDWRILASVVIFDPKTGKRFGKGLTTS